MKTKLTVSCIYCKNKIEIGNCRYSPYCAVNFRCQHFTKKDGFGEGIQWVYENFNNK